MDDASLDANFCCDAACEGVERQDDVKENCQSQAKAISTFPDGEAKMDGADEIKAALEQYLHASRSTSSAPLLSLTIGFLPVSACFPPDQYYYQIPHGSLLRRG